jgi:hypothetical protein
VAPLLLNLRQKRRSLNNVALLLLNHSGTELDRHAALFSSADQAIQLKENTGNEQ